ncbi:MAG: hypothetical protein L0H70_06075 [Xanthomonadales bacterium]|nr:hypothetical protein [Xanthomonadales bacterium]
MKVRLPITLIAALLLPLVAGAQPNAVRIDTVHTANNRTTISGVWPNACTPTIQSHSATLKTTEVVLGSTFDLCAPQPHPFRLTLPAELPFSPAPSPDRVRPLQIFAAASSNAPVQLVGLRVLGGRQQTSHPDAGFWWPENDTSSSGTVLSMELQGHALGVALMTYDDASGAPVWYFGTSQLQGSVAHVDLIRMQGGNSPFASRQIAPQAQHSLSLDLVFTSDTRAHIYLGRDNPQGGLDVSAMTIARVPFSALPQRQSWLGKWLLARTENTAGALALPTSFNWTSSTTLDATHVRLVDASGSYALECQYTDNDDNASAQNCQLRDADGNTLVVFNHVGFSRLDGHTRDGSAVILVRPR